ncbi:MAG TPA: TetR/AcrR family transcriptional regulator [Herpetosiphonaceae bacterium]|nr:TetR/AcrR family transcriptional regulator [Herpetosiphonaceae bacterium]
MRKTKRDWLMAGLEILLQAGAPALTIDRLTGALGMTKGSFYHHFKGFADYKRALLELYEDEGTADIIEQTDRQEGPGARLVFLYRLIAQAPLDLEAAIRAWSLHDSEVAEVQTRVDARRIEYVRALYAGLGAGPDQALLLARHAYAILIGSGHIQPRLEPAVVGQLFDELLELYPADRRPQ